MTDTTTVPTITTVDDAHALLRQLAEAHDWVSVFWDRGTLTPSHGRRYRATV